MAARPQKDQRTHPSSHTTYACLHTPERDERLSRLHQEGKIAKLHITRLEKKLTDLVEEDGIHLDDELDMKTIIDKLQNKSIPITHRILLSNFSGSKNKRLFQ